MNRCTIAAFTFCVLLSTPCEASRIYRFVNYPLIQEGHTLDGTITVTDDAPDDSFLDTDEILDWEWTLAGPNTISSKFPYPPGPISTYTDVHIISISPETIDLPLLIPSAQLLLRQSGPSGRSPAPTMLWRNYSAANDTVIGRFAAGIVAEDVFHEFWSSNLSSPGVSSWVIATAIPEPSSALLAVFCVAGGLAQRRSRLRPTSRQKL